MDKVGHIAKYCYKRKAKEEEEKEKPKVNLVENECEALSTINNKVGQDDWIIDSGCSIHMSNNKSLFKNYEPVINKNVKVANGKSMKVHGKGEVIIELINKKNLLVTNVLYIPDLKHNSLSVSKLGEKGVTISLNCCSAYLVVTESEYPTTYAEAIARKDGLK